NEIDASYQQLTTPLYPKDTVWTFPSVDQFITQLLDVLTKDAEQGGLLVRVPNQNVSMSLSETEPEKVEFNTTNAFDAFTAVAEFFAAPLVKFVDSKRGDLGSIRVYRLALYLEQLYARRR